MREASLVPWFRSRDWPAWQRVLGTALPSSWDDWSSRIRRTLRNGPRARYFLVTVLPADFQKWCRQESSLPSLDSLDVYAATLWSNQHEGGKALAWSVSHADRLVVADVVERVGPTDFHDFLNELASLGVMHFRKLIDLSVAPGLVRASSVTTLYKTLGGIRRRTPLGPVAFVVESDLAKQLTEILIGQMNERQRMKIFDRRFDAFEWLKSRPVPLPRKKRALPDAAGQIAGGH